MTPERWRAIGDQRVRAQPLVRRDLRALRPAADADRAVRPAAGARALPRRDRGPARSRSAGVASFTIPFNLSWHPAATVRAGLSRAGLPIGLQIVGPRHRDDLVLQAARAFERERPWHPEWPRTFRGR